MRLRFSFTFSTHLSLPLRTTTKWYNLQRVKMAAFMEEEPAMTQAWGSGAFL